MAHVSEFKKQVVEDITKLSKIYPIIGVVNMENLPAPQLQSMRSELRGKVEMFMTKKRLMKIALEKIKNDKKGVEELEKYFEGMPALIFTKDSPFKLSRILKKSKTSAPAKAGQIAPNDIVVSKGPTPFAPGPVISELSSAGLKVGVEGGKVAVKEDTVVAKKGEKITAKVAEILTRLDIKPMEVGLGLVAAYENGLIYQKSILDIDEKQYSDNVNLASVQAFNLAFNITYITNDNVNLLIGKAFNDSKALGMSEKILDADIIEDLLSSAESSMLSLKNATNIEVVEKPKDEIKEQKKVAEEEPSVKETTIKEKQETKEKIEEKKVEKPIEKEIKEEVKVEETPKKEVKPEVKIEPIKEEIREVKEEGPVIEGKESDKEEDIYEKESREKFVAEGEISPAEEGFMEGYEEAGKTKEEKKKEEKPKDEIDKKVQEMVEKTKIFMKGEEPTADDILTEVKTEQQQKEPKKEESVKEEVPSTHDLKKEKEEKERKEVEDLAKELVKKGTLRKK